MLPILDYVFVFRKKRTLLNEGSTGNILSRAFGVESRKDFRIFKVDVEIGIFNWTQKRVVAKGVVEYGRLPKYITASQITDRADSYGNVFFEPYCRSLRNWIHKKIDVNEPATQSAISKYRWWILGVLGLGPILLLTLL